MDRSIIDRNYVTHQLTADQLNQTAEIKCKAKELAILINDSCPESREKSLAFTELENSVMWATASIARN